MFSDVLFGLCIGIGLSAACGFRVFVPMLVVSIAAQTGDPPHLALSDGFQWIGTPLATVAFGAATGLEIAAYYIPWLDNALDTAATPLAMVAGTVLTASQLGEASPFFQWSLAIIAGAGAAGSVQLLTVGGRALSSLTTGGLGNPVVSTTEAGGSIIATILAIAIPIVAAVLVLLLVGWLLRRMLRKRKAKQSV